jgi:1,4-dihydroxy-6-naphthoate synthase
MTTLHRPISHDVLAHHPVRTLDIAYTPDSDDAFNFYAWEHRRVELRHNPAVFAREHIIALNHAAMLGTYDVVSISSVAYPAVAEQYWVLATGNSIGRGYGPVLVSRDYRSVEELRGRRVAVAGIPTTGGALAMMYIPGASFIEMRYDQIADAIARGEVDAGVMIHEELLFFPEKGLRRICCLGAAWCDDTGLPLPVGLNVVKRDLGRDLARQVAAACRRSLEWARANFDEAFAFASTFGRGCARQHVEMFSNDDTLMLKPDVRAAMRIMFDRVAALGIGPRLGRFEVIEG